MTAATRFAAYLQQPSLREVLLVAAQGQGCHLFRKGEPDGLWVLHPSRGDDPVHLASVALDILPSTLWADLEPPTNSAAAPA